MAMQVRIRCRMRFSGGLVVLAAAIIATVVGQDCETHDLEKGGQFSFQKDMDKDCTRWNLPRLTEQVFVLKIESIKNQITDKGKEYCFTDLMIGGINYCYMQPNTCFVVRHNKDASSHSAVGEECNPRISIQTNDATVKFNSRRKEKAFINITYQAFPSDYFDKEDLSTTESVQRTSIGTSSTPCVIHNGSLTGSPGFIGLTTGIPVAIPVALGIIALLLTAFLAVMIFRASQKGVLRVIFGGKSADGGGNSRIPQDGNDAALHSTVQEHSGRQNAPESSERQIVVNELYSMT